MYTLSEKTKENITNNTGIKYEEFSTLDCNEVDKRIEAKTGKKLRYPTKKDNRLLGRGSVFISLMRFI